VKFKLCVVNVKPRMV